MTQTHETTCRCNPCPGSSCTCGCQKTAQPNAQQDACACGPQCLCGADCSCASA